jgi:hypothetical protein
MPADALNAPAPILGLPPYGGRGVMPVAARKIEWETWSQSGFLAWAETRPEGCRYEFDGFQPVAIAPATVGHNRNGRNIREAIRTGPRSPCRRRSLCSRSCRPGGAIGGGTRRRSISTNRCPRYSAMLSWNLRGDRSERSGANLVRGRGAGGGRCGWTGLFAGIWHRTEA